MNMQKWEGYTFESSSGATPEFNKFNSDFKKYIKENLPENCTLDTISKGHFYISGFVKNQVNGKYVYFSISDVRWNNFTEVLIRTAENNRDFTGGANRFVDLYNFKDAVTNLIQ